MMIDLVDAYAERAIGQHDASQCDWLYGVETHLIGICCPIFIT